MKNETVEDFLARGGKVTRVEPGVASMDGKGIYRAVRGEQSLINERREVVDHMGRVRVRNGLGEWIA